MAISWFFSGFPVSFPVPVRFGNQVVIYVVGLYVALVVGLSHLVIWSTSNSSRIFLHTMCLIADHILSSAG